MGAGPTAGTRAVFLFGPSLRVGDRPGPPIGERASYWGKGRLFRPAPAPSCSTAGPEPVALSEAGGSEARLLDRAMGTALPAASCSNSGVPREKEQQRGATLLAPGTKVRAPLSLAPWPPRRPVRPPPSAHLGVACGQEQGRQQASPSSPASLHWSFPERPTPLPGPQQPPRRTGCLREG